MTDASFGRKARSAAARLAGLDPALGRLIARIGPVTFRPERSRTLFCSLVSAIAHQQLSGKAAGTILGRFIALFPGVSFPSPGQVLALAVTLLGLVTLYEAVKSFNA